MFSTRNACVRVNRYPAPFRGFADFLPAACNFSTIVFATFPDHHGHVVEQLLARACPGQQLILVIHNPEELLRTGVAACQRAASACLIDVMTTVLAKSFGTPAHGRTSDNYIT